MTTPAVAVPAPPPPRPPAMPFAFATRRPFLLGAAAAALLRILAPDSFDAVALRSLLLLPAWFMMSVGGGGSGPRTSGTIVHGGPVSSIRLERAAAPAAPAPAGGRGVPGILGGMVVGSTLAIAGLLGYYHAVTLRDVELHLPDNAAALVHWFAVPAAGLALVVAMILFVGFGSQSGSPLVRRTVGLLLWSTRLILGAALATWLIAGTQLALAWLTA